MDGISPEEYLVLERAAETRSEYCGGQMRPMPPSNRWHSLLVTNLLGEIAYRIKHDPYVVMAIQMRILVRSTGLFAYPDIVIVSNRPECLDREEDTLLDPIVLIEVLSPATEEWDRVVKVAHYRRLASLTDYILVSQDKVLVEHYSRQGDEWNRAAKNRLDESLHLTSIHCEVPLIEIYAKVFSACSEVKTCKYCHLNDSKIFT